MPANLENFNSGQRTGNGQFSFQSQRKAMPKSVQAARQLCSLCTSKVVLKILPGRLQQYMDQELPDAQTGKLGLEKAEESEIKLPTFVGL